MTKAKSTKKKKSAKSDKGSSGAKKKPARKAAARPAKAKKAASKKAAATKAPAKPAKKPAPKKPEKPASTKKAASEGGKMKNMAPGKEPAKPAPKPAEPAKPAAPERPKAAAPAATAAAAEQAKKGGPKGITIVNQRPPRRPKAKPSAQMPKTEPLLKPGGKWKPLIPSGPKAPPPTGPEAVADAIEAARKKPRFGKRDLEKYRKLLYDKRSELLGDITTMEDEALRQGSGDLSHTPQHMADQGTDAFDQAISLDLAAVDRGLLREIMAAIKRIEDGTYGICELTGRPISAERLAELPWARYSIEAARELERRPYQV